MFNKISRNMVIMKTILEICEICEIDKPCTNCLDRLNSDIDDYINSKSYSEYDTCNINVDYKYNKKCLNCLANINKSFIETYYYTINDFAQSCTCNC